MTTIDERGDVERQVLLHLAATISRGLVRPGERLPELDHLARELLVGPGHVSVALETLAERGAITRREAGATVTSDGPRVAATLLLDDLAESMRERAASAAHAGLDRADIAATFERVARAITATAESDET